MKQFSNTPLETTTKAVYCKDMGVETHGQSGSRTVNTADFRCFPIADALYFLAGLRERSCESMAGTTLTVFLTPYQARSFFARRKARKERKSNDLSQRRSSMKDKFVQLPPCADSGAIRHRLLQLGGLLCLLERELKAPADQKELEKILGVGWVNEFETLVVELHRGVGDALLGGLCPNAEYCMDSAVCHLQGNCLSQAEKETIDRAHQSYWNNRRGGAR